MDRTCSTRGRKAMHTGFWCGNQEERGSSLDLGVRKKSIFQWTLKQTGWESVQWINLAQNMDKWWATVNTVRNLQIP